MISTTVFSLVSLLAATGVFAQINANATGSPTTGLLGNASVTEDNTVGPIYRARLPDTAWDRNAFPDGGNIRGEVNATSAPDGIGVMFSLRFSNFPSVGGPFLYHIHVDPVPGSGNCTQTLAHLDPYIRGEQPPCNSTLPQTCQVGDLSGKYGKIEPDSNNSFEDSYTDLFVSTKNGIGSFFGNRSLVVHFGNTTRITCANFEDISGSRPVSATASTTPGSNSSATGPMSSPTTSPITAGATSAARFTDVALLLSFAAALAFVL